MGELAMEENRGLSAFYPHLKRKKEIVIEIHLFLNSHI